MSASDTYDLSGTLCQHLDKHLALALLEFLESRGVAGVNEAKLSIVEKTNMVDYAIDLYQRNGSKEVRGGFGTFSHFSKTAGSLFSRALGVVGALRLGNIGLTLKCRRIDA